MKLTKRQYKTIWHSLYATKSNLFRAGYNVDDEKIKEIDELMEIINEPKPTDLI